VWEKVYSRIQQLNEGSTDGSVIGEIIESAIFVFKISLFYHFKGIDIKGHKMRSVKSLPASEFTILLEETWGYLATTASRSQPAIT
jgi:hypothetical protein